MSDIHDYATLGMDLLNLSAEINESLGAQGEIEVKSDKDIVLEADIAISRAITKRVSQSGIDAVLFTEEFGRNQFGDNPQITIAFDDIDGTFNKKDGARILPYCSIVTIFDGISPRYQDASYAGILIHTTQDLFEAIKGKGVFIKGIKLGRNLPQKLGNTSRIYVNHYETSRATPEMMPSIGNLEARTISRDILSSGVAFALVAQHGHAYIGGRNKAHELGAGYLFMKESGGTILDFDGRDIGQDPYDFNEGKSMIAAVSQEIAEEILSELRTN